MNFGQAIAALKDGRKVLRTGWNGKGMYLFLVWSWRVENSPIETLDHYPVLPFIAMKTADDCIVPWLASQADMLASDWMILR